MPIYQYKCSECGHKFDIIKSIKNIDSIEKCNFCLSEKTKRVISAPRISNGKINEAIKRGESFQENVIRPKEEYLNKKLDYKGDFKPKKRIS